MDWKERALQLLKDSLNPVPTEHNEIDWKSALSNKTERLAQHICAFANQKGGGVLVFGVSDDGEPNPISKSEADNIIKTVGNIAHNNLITPILVEHDILDYNGIPLLFIYIPEQVDKPVHLRGKDIYESYTRSAGQTVKMSRMQIKTLIAESRGLSFELTPAVATLSSEQVLSILDYKKFYELMDKDIPSSIDSILSKLEEYSFCQQEGTGWSITNLGGILFASNLNDFPSLATRKVIVHKYVGTNNRSQEFEYQVKEGYAIAFENLVDFIVSQTSTERISTMRESVPQYPRVAIREFVANALVHQDFTIIGIPIFIEIFSNRIVITNPGTPLNDINRLIDLPPNSRNEKLAQSLFLLRMCERRRSGIDRAIEAIETMSLPAAKIDKGDSFTRVTLFPKKSLNDMSKQERILACYQHACLLYEDGKSINNQSVRDRFGIERNKSAIASRIISDTLDAGYIKISDADVTSRKYAAYIPYYA